MLSFVNYIFVIKCLFLRIFVTYLGTPGPLHASSSRWRPIVIFWCRIKQNKQMIIRTCTFTSQYSRRPCDGSVQPETPRRAAARYSDAFYYNTILCTYYNNIYTYMHNMCPRHSDIVTVLYDTETVRGRPRRLHDIIIIYNFNYYY